jgi:hypothetical protein
MRHRANKFNDNPTTEDAWWDEIELFEYDQGDHATAACANLADELVAYKLCADEDPSFQSSLEDWDYFVYERNIWLALEQACYQGVLLPKGQIELRVKTCPKEWRDSLGYFLGHSPAHVKHHLALRFWFLVRLDRARRTGNPDWNPERPPPRPPFFDTVFFQPPKLKYRSYAR